MRLDASALLATAASTAPSHALESTDWFVVAKERVLRRRASAFARLVTPAPIAAAHATEAQQALAAITEFATSVREHARVHATVLSVSSTAPTAVSAMDDTVDTLAKPSAHHAELHRVRIANARLVGPEHHAISAAPVSQVSAESCATDMESAEMDTVVTVLAFVIKRGILPTAHNSAQ
jgi:hypothetical protein